MKFRMITALAAVTFACALPALSPASADDFPSHTMTMVIPFAAGGPTDILGRVVAGRMSEILGQTVIVENVGGAGSATHLGCVLLNYVIGVNVTHVPYRGTGPALQDLEGGRVDYMCDIITTAKPPIDQGAVKGVAILDTKRSPALPNIPTAAEQGTPNLVAYTWNAIFLPKNTPEPVVKKIHDAALAAMHTPAVHDKLTALGAEIVSDQDATPAHLGELVKSEITKWAAPIKASGVSVE
jgi:tripartite-type tricarboxylate transporter receptor subunit TctC